MKSIKRFAIAFFFLFHTTTQAGTPWDNGSGNGREIEKGTILKLLNTPDNGTGNG